MQRAKAYSARLRTVNIVPIKLQNPACLMNECEHPLPICYLHRQMQTITRSCMCHPRCQHVPST